MLIITRRVGETFYIGDAVTVTVVGVHGSQVRVGVNAPRNVVIDREEVRLRKQREMRRELNLALRSAEVSSNQAGIPPTVDRKVVVPSAGLRILGHPEVSCDAQEAPPPAVHSSV